PVRRVTTVANAFRVTADTAQDHVWVDALKRIGALQPLATRERRERDGTSSRTSVATFPARKSLIDWWVWKRERLALTSAETDMERSVRLSRCLAPARDANSGSTSQRLHGGRPPMQRRAEGRSERSARAHGSGHISGVVATLLASASASAGARS